MRVSDVLRHLRQQPAAAEARPRLLHRYAAFLPLTDATPPLSLGEGYTPLVHATRLGRGIGCPELHPKLEGLKPPPPPGRPAPAGGWRSSSCCRPAGSRPASWSRRRWPGRRSWPWRATSTTRCASCASWPRGAAPTATP